MRRGAGNNAHPKRKAAEPQKGGNKMELTNYDDVLKMISEENEGESIDSIWSALSAIYATRTTYMAHP